MGHFFTFLLVFTTSLLIGCQSRKKLDCSRVDWRTQGRKAASLGKEEEGSLTTFTKQCRKKNRLIDAKAYSAGYNDGLKIFCNTKIGLSMGSSGGTYKNTCPESSETPFLKGYINGRILYLQGQVNQGVTEYTNAKDRFWRKEQEYLLLKNEDPEEAKMQRDFLEAYQEESNLLGKDLDILKKELSYLKRKKQELKFN